MSWLCVLSCFPRSLTTNLPFSNERPNSGVDFMAESVRAMLDTSGFETVPVYRLSEKAIGCSLAEAAEGKEYRAWLEKAKNTPNR